MEFLQDWGLIGLFTGAFLSATILPMSSDVMLVAALLAKWNPWLCYFAATAGNWTGSLSTYALGYLGKWEWIERWFKVSKETLEKQKAVVDKWGIWLALVVWIPFAGDIFCLALGFYRTPFWKTSTFILIGKALRFAVWMLLFFLYGEEIMNWIY